MFYEPIFALLPENPENPDALVFWCVATLGSLSLLCATIFDLFSAIS